MTKNHGRPQTFFQAPPADAHAKNVNEKKDKKYKWKKRRNVMEKMNKQNKNIYTIPQLFIINIKFF